MPFFALVKVTPRKFIIVSLFSPEIAEQYRLALTQKVLILLVRFLV